MQSRMISPDNSKGFLDHALYQLIVFDDQDHNLVFQRALPLAAALPRARGEAPGVRLVPRLRSRQGRGAAPATRVPA